MNIKDRIVQVRRTMGLTQREFARKLDLKQQVVSFYETGRSECPLPVLVKISELSGVAVDWLLTGKGSVPGGQGIQEAGTINTNVKTVGGVFVPIVSRVHAGDPDKIYLEQDVVGTVFVTGGRTGQFALQIEGDSMQNTNGHKSIESGDIAVVDPNQDVMINDVVLVVVKGRHMIKQLKKQTEKQITLGSFNPDYADIHINIPDVELIRRVVEIHRKIKL